jgi:UDP-glucose 6-dehydrogenase
MNNFEFDIENFKFKINALCEKNVDFMDALITICEKEGIEIDNIFPILKKDNEIKEKLFIHAEKLHFLKK